MTTEDSEQTKTYSVEDEKEKKQRFLKYLIDRKGEAILVGEAVDDIDGIDHNHVNKTYGGHLPYFFYKVDSFHRAEGRYFYAEVDWTVVVFSSLILTTIIITLGWALVFGV